MFCLHLQGRLYRLLPSPDDEAGFRLGECAFQLRSVISVVFVHNSLCWVSYASFFLPAVVSILHYGWTICTQAKRMEKNLDDNCTRMQLAALNKSWKQHPTKQPLNGHLIPISKTIQIRRTRRRALLEK